MSRVTKSTILVIDDDNDSRFLLEIFLLQQGFQVLQAAHGLEGIRLLQQEAVDIVLLDVMLPDIDGFACCKKMHETLAEDCPPVLMITGLNDEKSIDKAFAVKATDFITKPVNFSILGHRIKRVLRERELFHQLAEANARLLEVAQTDGLTKTANRYRFQNVLHREWRRLAREQQCLAILMCDLDAFKQYNDSLGHLAGDACLQQFAAVLKSAVNRTTDLVARYGGEEFVVLLPNTGVEGLQTVDARIRQRFSEKRIVHPMSSVDAYVTYSAGGVVAVPDASVSPRALVNQADKALYEAKDLGRNRSVIEQSVNLSPSVG